MADEDLGTASVEIVIDDSAADAGLTRLSNKIERALDEAARDGARRLERQINRAIIRVNPITLRVRADTRDLQRTLNGLNNLGRSPIKLTPDIDRPAFQRAIQAALDGLEVKARVVPDFTGFNRAVRAHQVPPIDVPVRANIDRNGLTRSLSALNGALGKLTKITAITLAIGGLGIAAAGAAAAVGGLLAALAPLTGLIAAAPATILGFVGAITALKVALSGVSDAFGAALSGDAKKFDKALKELSPAAQKVARDVRAIKPEVDKLKATVQDAFFVRLAGEVDQTATALSGPLTRGLSNISTAWGAAAKSALDYVQSSRGVANITSILKGSQLAVQGLSASADRLTQGFLQAGATISDAFGARVRNAIGGTLKDFGNFLTTAAGDGRLVQWVNDAVAALRQLGDIVGNIGGIFSGLFKASGEAGTNFLTNLQKITQAFETFVKSAEGQQALTGIFQTIGAVASQLGPIFTSLVTAVGAVVPALAPLLSVIGPALTGLIQALVPAIQAILPAVITVVNAIVSALGTITQSGVLDDIGAALGTVITAIAPILPVVGELVASIAQALAPAVSALAQALTPVIKALAGALAPILPPLVDVVLQLVDALTPVVSVLGVALAGVIKAVSPILITLATILGTIAQAVAPLITLLFDALAPVIEALAPIVTRLVAAIAPLITALVGALLPVLQPLVDTFIALFNAFVPLLDPVVQLVEALAPLLVMLVNLLAPIIGFAAEIIKWLAIEAVIPVLSTLVKILSVIIQVVAGLLGGVKVFVDTVVKYFTEFGTKTGEQTRGFSDNLKKVFSELWDAIKRAALVWLLDMKKMFDDLKVQLAQKVQEFVTDSVAFFQSLPGKAESAISDLANVLGQVAADAGNRFLTAINEKLGEVLADIQALPGDARAALGDLGGALYSAGQDLVRGLANGIRDMASSVAASARDVVGNAISAAKDALGIASPSKVFREIGVFIGQGLVRGLTASIDSVRKTADKLVNLIREAFQGKAGKKTRLDDDLIKTVRSNQRELEKLLTQREALAKRIQEANQFAVDVATSVKQAFGIGNLFDEAEERFDRLAKLFRGKIPGFLKVSKTSFLTQEIKAATAQITRFNNQVNNLAKRGLNRSLIEQLIELGPQEGAALAEALSKATDKELKDLNAAQTQLNKAADTFGKNSADKLFDAGKNAADGFLAGLKSQQKAIEDLLVSIAKSMTTAIKAALKIKSPSRVLSQIGVFTGQGLVKGIEKMRARVALAARDMASAVVSPFQGQTVATPVMAPVRPVEGIGNLFGYPTTPATAEAARRTVKPPQDVTVTNNFVINEVGNAETTASRVVNRLALSAGIL